MSFTFIFLVFTLVIKIMIQFYGGPEGSHMQIKMLLQTKNFTCKLKMSLQIKNRTCKLKIVHAN